MALTKRLAALAILTSAFDIVQAQSGADILSFVDPLIGTVNGGHVFPGASLPFSMAKAVADVTGEKQGGFASDGSNITGFSHMHDSGTGGVSQPRLLYSRKEMVLRQGDDTFEIR